MPADCPEHSRQQAIWLHLDDVALARKLGAAPGYPEFRDEVRRALERFGPDISRSNACVRRVRRSRSIASSTRRRATKNSDDLGSARASIARSSAIARMSARC
jgi:hypothetical protein